MAKSKPAEKSKKLRSTQRKSRRGHDSQESPSSLLRQASILLQTGQPDIALQQVNQVFGLVPENSALSLPAINMLGEILVEIGDVENARAAFLKAVEIDPEGDQDLNFDSEDIGGAAEKFLWLAQLCEEGGKRSVCWYENGMRVLRRRIKLLEDKKQATVGRSRQEIEELLEEQRAKLSNALCGVAEIYMTDLSLDPNAESICESRITDALLVSPSSPETLQTLASIRISQLRIAEARSALSRSLGIWKDLPPEDTRIPAFSIRISLARLLMEVGSYTEALDVLEHMLAEDDESVETWYLGGWASYLLGHPEQYTNQNETDLPIEIPKLDDIQKRTVLRTSARWLRHCLQLYDKTEYEDEPLKEHAIELSRELVKEVGEVGDDDSDEEWVDEDLEEYQRDEDEDEVMKE